MKRARSLLHRVSSYALPATEYERKHMLSLQTGDTGTPDFVRRQRLPET